MDQKEPCGCMPQDVIRGIHNIGCPASSDIHFSSAYKTKDSGKREEFITGMVRDTQDDKPRYDLIDRIFLKRWAELMARGAKKYGENNWRKAATEEELRRFEASAIRHIYQWLGGDLSEDHAVAVAFNLAGAEMVREKLNKQVKENVCCSCDGTGELPF
jgi:Domain of unknown function (DUF5664)